MPLNGALALYGLSAATVFRESIEDSKVLIAWGVGDDDRGTIVVAFRGTASLQNMLSDIQVRLVLGCASQLLQALPGNHTGCIP